jgi:hypothetical protein
MKNLAFRNLTFSLLSFAALSSFAVASDARKPSLDSSLSISGSAGASFIELAELTASDGTRKNQLGFSVAISGNTVVVGAPGANDGQNQGAGAVYVFVKPGNGWANMTQTAKLTCSNETTPIPCGSVVAVSGNTIVTNGYDPTISQTVGLVFVRPSGGWKNMTQTAELTVTDQGAIDAGFNAIAVSGNTVVAGSWLSSVFGTQEGEAYVFVEPSGGWGNMTQTAILSPSDGQKGYLFGSSVSFDGTAAVIGALGANTNEGAAYIFVQPAGGWTNMTQTAELTASNGVANASFGASVEISGTTVAVGAPAETIGSNTVQGATFVFVEPVGGWQDMTETAELTTSTGRTGNQFGYSVSASGNAIIIGAPNVKIGSDTAQGAAYIFEKPPSGWATTSQPASKFSAGTQGSNFGTSVALGTTAVGGAPTGVTGGTKSTGATYIFGP